MRAEWCETGPSTRINLDFRSATEMSRSNPMDINAMLNPKTEEADDVKIGGCPMTACYELPFHSRAIPVEPGGSYAHNYLTPANSPTHQYSTMSSHQPPCGPLPRMNVLYQDYPSPPLAHTEYLPMQSMTQLTIQLNHSQPALNCALTNYHDPRQLQAQHSQRRPSYPPIASHMQLRQSSPHPRSHRSSRSERDYLHSRASAPTSPTTASSPPYPHKAHQMVGPPPPKKLKPTFSNEAYPQEQVHWMRYQKIDANVKWPAIEAEFPIKFNQDRTVTQGGLSSRYYRDNVMPRIDKDGKIMYDSSGKALGLDMKVRSKDVGDCKGAPWTFVERHPWMALEYEWVSVEHKKIAAKIVADIEKTDASQYTRKQQFIVAIREFERQKDSSKQTRRNGSLSDVLTYSGDDEDLFDAAALPTAEEIEEDERYMDELYKEAAQQKCIS
ncbi:hypothetical protein BDZ45DRAFT_674953 [Acephala macrosclerotiorum]|nr:hypothetical protein BDZ45DRAFT_674953 [Acephala macrosclerotiorum]